MTRSELGLQRTARYGHGLTSIGLKQNEANFSKTSLFTFHLFKFVLGPRVKPGLTGEKMDFSRLHFWSYVQCYLIFFLFQNPAIMLIHPQK